ncbi:MAG TPA: hypothetical protein VFQ23_13490 [Anaerolineales bacterium]|nr:hypothetical protein [Anaerolineales bacterium]
MPRKREIIVGKFYVSSDRRIAREVLSTSLQTVRFNTYHLDTGNSCGTPSECLIQDFVRWATREASPKELAFLQNQGIETP